MLRVRAAGYSLPLDQLQRVLRPTSYVLLVPPPSCAKGDLV